MRARVLKSGKREFSCKILESNEMVQATALGKLLKGKEIVVGDYVDIETIEETGEYQISSVEERNNEIFRVIVRENKRKVTAANCDLMIILTSVSRPEYKRGIVDRFLVRAYQWDIEPVVVFNKMDEFNSDELDISFETERLSRLGIKTFETSAKFQDYQKMFLELGIEDLKDYIRNKTSIFLGQSGVGKSKIISALSDGEIELLSQQVGRAGKGSHTTTWSEIIECKAFSTIDSPGIRSFSLEDISPDDLIEYFPDLVDIACKCKFSNCAHSSNTKGCAFWELDQDNRDTQLIMSRLDSFRRIYSEISQTPQWAKKI